MHSAELKELIAKEFGTPAVVIDMDIVERNIKRVQAICEKAGVGNRPHIKTHKSVRIADLQRRAGAVGITCQKLSEGEVMAAGGHDNILISYNILGESKIGRLGRLLSHRRVIVSCDSAMVASGLSRAAEIAGRSLEVLVECDTGRKRAGVTTVSEVVSLAKHIHATKGLIFAGLMLYPPDGKPEESRKFHIEAIEALAGQGLHATIVSTGGTPNLKDITNFGATTEHRPGTYVFNDLMNVAAGSATLADCAVSVYTTVVSRAEPNRGVVDAGSKTLTSDTGGLSGYGQVVEYPHILMPRLMEEHGFIEMPILPSPYVGEIVRVIPNHVCVVINMVDNAVLVRDGSVEGTLKIDARGCII